MSYSKSSNLAAVPAASANGTKIPRVYDCNEVVFYLAAGESLTYTIAENDPTSPPGATVVVLGDNSKSWQEVVPSNVNLYITAKTGNPTYRWVKS